MNQVIYDVAISKGCKPRLAEALACRKMRTGMTDKQFCGRARRLGDELAPDHAARVARKLEAAGVDVDSNTMYYPNMARYEGDPQAAFRPSDGRGEIVRRAEAQGMVRDTSVGRDLLKFDYPKPDQHPLDKPPSVADDIVVSEIRQMMRENPDVAHEPKVKLREEIIKKRSPSRGPKGQLRAAKG